MTAIRIPLDTPFLDLATFASTLTARGSHAQALALLASDAAGGHPRQRATIDRTRGGVYHVMLARGAARYVLVRVFVGRRYDSLTPLSTSRVNVSFEITDGTTTITASDPRIPDGLRGDTDEPAPILNTENRLDALGARDFVIDLAAFDSGSPSLSGTRRTLSFTINATSLGNQTYCELLSVEEIPRFAVDDAEDYGVLPQNYLPRARIVDGATGTQRLWETARYGYTHGVRSYHALVRAVAAPWAIVDGSAAPWPDDTESAGVAKKYVVNARTMQGTTDPRVAFRVRYRAVGASPGDVGKVALTTGAGSYTLTLTDVSGAWAEAEAQGYLDALTPEQSISWTGYRTGSGTWEICSRTVFDDPA